MTGENDLKYELRGLLDKAAKKHGSRKKALEVMGIKGKTMEDVLYGKRSQETVIKYILAVEKFLKKSTDDRRDEANFEQITKKYGGETSEREIPFVITEGSFRQINGYPGKAGLDFTVKNIQLLRATLNIFSQLADNSEREKIRKTLGPEIEELFLAMKVFSQAYPNKILELMDKQRQHWDAITNEKIVNKK